MELLEIGKVIRPHGIDGRMKVQSYLESSALLTGLAEVGLGPGPREAVRFALEALQPARGSFLMKLKGVDDRDQAERYRGSAVWMSVAGLKRLPKGEYYWRDLIGLQVVTEGGEPLGCIEGIFPTGSNDVYVCRDGQREILLPAISDCVRNIDLDRKVMTVRILEGLVTS